MKLLLRLVLTLLLVVLGLEVGIRLAPRLARWTGAGPRSSFIVHRSSFLSPRSPVSGAAQPDWGGGSLVRDMIGERRETRDGVVLRKKAGGDYALTLALPSNAQTGQAGLFELPSTDHFKKQLFPEGMGTRSDIMSPSCSAEAPAADIPLYPQSSCRMQTGQGTACFIGFYLTADSIEAVRSFYLQSLVRLGWERIATGDGRRETGRTGPRSPVSGHSVVETLAKPGEDRLVVVQLRKQDSVTTRIGLVAMTSGELDTEDGGRRTVVGPRSPVSSFRERK